MDAGRDGNGGDAGRGFLTRAVRDRLDRLVEALDVARGPLGDLQTAAVAGEEPHAGLVVATTAAQGVLEAAGLFLAGLADGRRAGADGPGDRAGISEESAHIDLHTGRA